MLPYCGNRRVHGKRLPHDQTAMDECSPVNVSWVGSAAGLLAILAVAGPAAAAGNGILRPRSGLYVGRDTPAGSIDGDLMAPEGQTGTSPANANAKCRPLPDSPAFEDSFGDYATAPAAPAPIDPAPIDPASPEAAPAAGADSATYAEDDLIGAAEGVFREGRGRPCGGMIEDLLEKQGKPNAYIVGREAGGAFIVGARYGFGHAAPQDRGTQQVVLDRPVDRFRRRGQCRQHLRAGLQSVRTARTCSNVSRQARGRPISSAGCTPATCAGAMWC